jgi:hypothetical protein
MFETVCEALELARTTLKDFIPEGYIEGSNSHVEKMNLIFVSLSSILLFFASNYPHSLYKTSVTERNSLHFVISLIFAIA